MRRKPQSARHVETKERLRFETLLAGLCAQFVNVSPSDLDSKIENAQRLICKALRINHSSVWQVLEDDPDQLVMTHAYRDPKVKPLPTRPILKRHFPWSQNRIRNKEIICIPNTAKVPAEATVDRESWLQYGVRSTLAFPLSVGGGSVIGFLAFDSTKERDWQPTLQRRLQILAHVFAQALDRKKSEQKVKMAQDALRASEVRLHLAIDSGSVGGWDFDLKTDRNIWFGKAHAQLGMTPEETLGSRQEFWEHVHEDDREHLRHSMREAKDKHGEFIEDFRVVWRDGTTHWLRSRGRYHYSRNGEPERMLGISLDITQSKQAEQALRESEQRFLLAAQAGKMYSFEWDVRTGAVVRSPEYVTVLGATEQAHSTHRQFVDKIHPDDRPKFIATISGLTPDNPTGIVTFRVVNPDGSLVWLRSSGRAVFDDQGRMLRVIGMVADVTDQKQAEEGLRASEERLRLAQWAARIGTFDFNIRTGVNIWTPETEAMYGLPPGGFGGTLTAFENLIHPDDRERIIELNREMMRTGQATEAEWRVVWPNGSVHWIAGREQVLKDESGKPSRMLGVNLDITERKLAEEARFRLAAIVESSEDAIASGTLDGIIVSWNAGAQRIYGYTEAEAIGKPIGILLPPELEEEENKILETLTAGGRVAHFETVRVTKGGKRINVSLTISPIKDSSGRTVGVSGVARDITERKLAEDSIREMNRALEGKNALLQAREELLRVFVQNVPVGVAMLDRDMRYLLVSDRWCSDNSVKASELLGRSREDLPEMPERWKEFNRRALQGETLQADEDHWESGGITRWNRWEVRPWRNPDGTVGGILVFAEDITPRKQMEQELSGMSRKLIESQEQDRARIGRDLHDDINQQLAMLAVEIDQLRRDPRLSSAKVKTRLTEIRDRIHTVATDVQSISHQLHSPQLELIGIVAATRSFCREFAARQEVTIDFTHDDVPNVTHEVSLCLFRVLQEALHNAVKHSNVRHYEVRLGCSANAIDLTVSDRGTGFDAKTAMSGRGLGLVSMRERVRLVNGTIVIDSKPMGGTTIHVRVPFSEQGSQRAAG